MPFVREFYAHERIRVDESQLRTALERLLDDPLNGRVWVISAEDEPVGYLALTFGFSLEYGGRDAMLDEIFVHESHRGRGLGAQALRVAENACRELGVRALHLEVERANVAAQRLYRANGFIDHDRYLMTRDVPTTS